MIESSQVHNAEQNIPRVAGDKISRRRRAQWRRTYFDKFVSQH